MPGLYAQAQTDLEVRRRRILDLEAELKWAVDDGMVGWDSAVRSGTACRELRAELKDALAECKATEARCDALEDSRTGSGLSAAEVERLALLMMAAGKLAAEAAKVVLHGWASRSPATGKPTYVDVERALGRVMAAQQGMVDAGDVRGGDVRAYARDAVGRIGGQAGTLDLRAKS